MKLSKSQRVGALAAVVVLAIGAYLSSIVSAQTPYDVVHYATAPGTIGESCAPRAAWGFGTFVIEDVAEIWRCNSSEVWERVPVMTAGQGTDANHVVWLLSLDVSTDQEFFNPVQRFDATTNLIMSYSAGSASGVGTGYTEGFVFNTGGGGHVDSIPGLQMLKIVKDSITVGSTGRNATLSIFGGLVTTGGSVSIAEDGTLVLDLDAVTASTTHTQAGATELSCIICNVTSANADDTIRMPDDSAMRWIFNTSGQTIGLYPAGSFAIGDGSAAAKVDMPDNTAAMCVQVSGSKYECYDLGRRWDVAPPVIDLYAQEMGTGGGCTASAVLQIGTNGPGMHTINCADSDTATIWGCVDMPQDWDAGTITYRASYVQTAVDTSQLHSDIAAQCRGTTEAIDGNWGTEIAIDDANVTGSDGLDRTTSAAVTPNGACAAGDQLCFRYQIDAAGTSTAVATLYFLGFQIGYSTN